jgi:uncharacterized membrane-anchored protein
VARRCHIAAVLWLVLAAAALGAPGTAGAQPSAPTGGDPRNPPPAGPLEDRDPRLATMERHHGGTHVLPISKSTLKVSSEFDVLLGDYAQSYFSVKNSAMAVSGLEAVLVHRSSSSTVYLVAEDTGYVALDDWASVDPADLLSEMRSHHTVTNIEAAPDGVRPPEVQGWRQKPELDRQSATVFWSVNTTIGGKPFLQATLLELGRHGVEKLVWIGDPATDPRPILNTVKASLSLAPDARYQDYRAGDKVAGSGVDKLVKASVGLGRMSIGAGTASLEAVQTAALAMVGISGAMFVVAFRLRSHKKKVMAQKDA